MSNSDLDQIASENDEAVARRTILVAEIMNLKARERILEG
jgi:hypothetical protein